MRELSARDPVVFALAIAIASSDRRPMRRRKLSKHRRLLIDECLDILRDPSLSPNVSRLRPGGFDPADAQRRQLCAETLELFEEMAPIVRALAER